MGGGGWVERGTAQFPTYPYAIQTTVITGKSLEIRPFYLLIPLNTR